MAESIIERMANSKLLLSQVVTTGESPQKTVHSNFYYQNGLITSYDGKKWSVLQTEFTAWKGTHHHIIYDWKTVQIPDSTQVSLRQH